MMQQPLISVIVPVYNVEQYLDECVSSLRNQSYQNLEILLIDDGSPDDCPAMCDTYASEDHRVRVIHKKNGGLADARNTGLDHATGDFIAFVDSDDWIAPETYSEMIQMIQSNLGLDIVCCAASRIVRGVETEVCFSYYETDTVLPGREVTRRMLLDEIGSQVVKGLYRRICWEGVRFPLGRLYEDISTTFKAYLKADYIGFINKPFYKYRTNDEGISYTAKAIKPYHIYLGFRSHYECAAVSFPEIADKCCANTAHYAISTYFHYCSEKSKELEPVIAEVRHFIDSHKQVILQDRKMIRSRRLALQIYYFSPMLFKFFCRAFCVLGLQKLLGFEMK